MKYKKQISFLLSFIMVIAVCTGYFPTYAKETSDLNMEGLCVHHPSHTSECGYIKAEEGEPCTHQHDETCGYVEGEEGSCTHQHDENCGYTAATEGSPCSYAVNGCPYCVTSWDWQDDQDVLNESADSWEMSLAGVSQDNPITRDSLAELLPEQITAITDDGGEKTLDITWDLTAIPEEGASEGDFQVTASLADGAYALTEDAAPLALTVKLGGAETYDLQMPSGTPPYSEHIVDGVSPNGTTINLFDYWLTSQDASDASDPADLANQGINKDHALLFFKNGKGLWNQWTGSKRIYSGIVKDKLVDGYPELNLNTENAQNVAGRDGNESLAYLFNPSYQCEGKASYTDVQGLLQVDDEGYYYYNSQENYATYYEDTNSFTLYEYPGIIPGGTSPVGQFFPFNEANANAESVSYKGKNYTLMNTLKSDNGAINHHFGIHMSTRFIQQYGGYTNDPENGGKAVTYEFSGDDDVWIFIDGTLVGDLGGIHDAASIKINFATGEIEINGQKQTKTLGELLGLGSDTLANNTYHTLDFFYLERGNFDSNMYLKYNLVTIPESGLIKVDQLGNRIYGAEFTLYGAEDYQKNGEGAKPVATGSTDSNGQFIFLTQTNDGESRPITIAELYDAYKDEKDDQENNLVLVETKTPAGYRTCGEIGLYFYQSKSKETLLLSSDSSIWNQGAYAMPKVTATTGNEIELLKNPTDVTGTTVGDTVDLVGSDAVENPTMFAVVLQKQKDGEWYPVSGDPLTGWDVEEDNSWENILNAAKRDSYIFQLSTSGAYQVEIDNLPGNVQKYYHICQNKDEAQYTIAYYYTEADSLSGATEENTWRINSESTQKGLERAFSVNLYITNMKNRLLVQKVDDAGHTVNGAQFSLYKSDEVTVTTDGDGTQTVTPKEGADPAVVTTGDITTPLQLSGAAVFPDNAGDGYMLENGEYWLVETSAPTGYKIKTDPVHVVVDNTGVYADAGTADDGVTVLRGVGSVARSMIQFAVDDGVDITLRDVKAALADSVEFKGYNENGSFTYDPNSWDATGTDILHLTYTNTNKMLDYGLQGGTGTATLDDLTLETDVGWSKLLIRQCYEHDDSVNTDLKTELGERDITNLFSGTVTVRVENDKTGNLKISKKVTGDGAPADQEFTFEVTMKEGDSPLAGTYETLDANGNKSKITFNDGGKATVTLKDGESLTILALPAGAQYAVQEVDLADGYTPGVTVSGDNSATTDSETATGTIQHNTEENAAVEVAYTNEFDGSTTARLKVTKTVTGDMGDRDKLFDFTITLKDKDGTALSGSYPYTIGTTTGTLDLNDKGTATFQLKHGQTIVIYGLPSGSLYQISEPGAKEDGYTTTVTVGGETETAYQTEGNLSDTDTVTVSFENSRGHIPVTGIQPDQLPWILLTIGVLIAGVVLILINFCKKRRIMK